MDFQDVLNNKIADLTQQRNDKQADLLKPEHHREELTQALASVSKQLIDLDLDKEELLNETLSILNQIPDFAFSVWVTGMKDIRALEEQMTKWSEMRDMYEDWVTTEKAKAALERAKAEIKDNVVEEPSKVKAMRRKPGSHPGMTLSTFRRASSELEEGEDSEE